MMTLTIPYELEEQLLALGFRKDNVVELWMECEEVEESGILWQQAFEWFEKEHNLDSYVRKISTKPTSRYYWKINILKAIRGEEVLGYSDFSNSRDEASIECLKKLVELCKSN